MRKIFVTIVAVLAFAMVAAATDYPTSELYAGYNWTRFYPDSAFVPDLNANGGVGQFTYNFDKWIGATFDVGSVTKGTINHHNFDTTATSFTLGPRFTYHNHSRWTPYFEVLFGGAEVSASTELERFVAPPVVNPLINPPIVLPPGVVLPPGRTFVTRITTSETGFAMLAGGGLDIKVGKRFAFRPRRGLIGADTKPTDWRYQP